MNDQTNKADAGKLEPRLLFEGMPRALLLIIAVLTYGAKKYSAHSWKQVKAERYRDAKLRHMLDELAGLGAVDAESGLLHEAHEICNSLFVLQQFLEPLSPEQFRAFLVSNDPPTAHKTGVQFSGGKMHISEESYKIAERYEYLPGSGFREIGAGHG